MYSQTSLSPSEINLIDIRMSQESKRFLYVEINQFTKGK